MKTALGALDVFEMRQNHWPRDNVSIHPVMLLTLIKWNFSLHQPHTSVEFLLVGTSVALHPFLILVMMFQNRWFPQCAKEITGYSYLIIILFPNTDKTTKKQLVLLRQAGYGRLNKNITPPFINYPRITLKISDAQLYFTNEKQPHVIDLSRRSLYTEFLKFLCALNRQ